MRETILLFQIPDKKIRLKIEMALFPLRTQVRYIREEDYHQPLGVLANIKDLAPAEGTYTGEPLPAPMLVFCGLSEQKLNQALAALRKSGAGPLPYKAVLTPTNQTWKPMDCFEELKREHEYMSSQNKPVHEEQ